MQSSFERRENRFLHIDGLRALSVIWMIGFHSIFYLGYFISKNEYLTILGRQQHFRLLLDGQFGVDVFFAISGFLITLILLVELKKHGSIQFGTFYLRRFFRIIPIYLASLFLCRYLVGTSGLNNIWANFFLVNNYIPTSDQFMGWAWSLAMEWQFYLFFPIFIVVTSRLTQHPARVIILLLLGSLLLRYFVIRSHGLQELLPFTPFFNKIGFKQWFDGWYDKTHLRLSGILVGVLAAFYYLDSRFIKHIKAQKPYLKALLLFGGIYFIWSITAPQTCLFDYCSENINSSCGVLYETLKHFMVSLITAGLILYCAGPGGHGIANRVLSSKILRPFAELSLAAYLLHPIVIIVFYRVILAAGIELSKTSLGYLIIFIELITFSTSSLLYFFIERPFRTLGYRATQSSKQRATKELVIT